MKKETIKTRTAVITVDEDGILRAITNKGAEDTLADSQQNIAACGQLSRGHRRPALVDLRGVKSHSAEARAYYSGPEAEKVLAAVGLLVKSPVSRMVGNFFLGLNKPTYPLKLFTSDSEALIWLRGYL